MGEQSVELKLLETTLSKQFSTEMTTLKKLQEDNDRQRKDEADKRKEQQDALIAQILNSQVTELEDRKKSRAWVMKYILAPLAVVLAGGGTVGYLQVSGAPTKVQPADVREDVKRESEALEKSISELEKRVSRGDRIHERMVKIQLDQQVELSESVQYLGAKIDRISSRATTIDAPASVLEGRRKADAIKASRGSVPEYDPADPLADIHGAH